MQHSRGLALQHEKGYDASKLLQQVIQKVDIENTLDTAYRLIPGPNKPDRKTLSAVLFNDPELHKQIESLVKDVRGFKGGHASDQQQLTIIEAQKRIASYLTNKYPQCKGKTLLPIEQQTINEKTRELLRTFSNSLTANIIDIDFALNQTHLSINQLLGKDNPLSKKTFSKITNEIKNSQNPSEALSLVNNSIWLYEEMKNKSLEALR